MNRFIPDNDFGNWWPEKIIIKSLINHKHEGVYRFFMQPESLLRMRINYVYTRCDIKIILYEIKYINQRWDKI